jgi:hypothetical protein
MKKRTGKMIWGLLFVAIGILIILRQYLGIQFPLVKVILGLFLVFMGVKILFTSFVRPTPGTPTRLGPSQNIAAFNKSRFEYIANGKPQSFHTFFTNSDIDLSRMDLSRGDVEININVFFGEMVIVVGTTIPIQLEAKANFGEIVLPNKKKITKGSYTFQSEIFKVSGSKINMNVTSTFGDVRIFYGKY